ncbi:LuxR C-terminal-related transcriptional regulator [Mycolicibacterium phlei]
MRFTWPLIGRASELRAIAATISDPGTAGVVVRGAAGVGKSRLVAEALQSMASARCRVRRVAATSATRGVPLGALSSLVEPAGQNAVSLVRQALAALAAPAGTVVVGVDDAHLLDDLSTFVLSQAVDRRIAKVLLTVRDDESIPAAVQEIWRNFEFRRLDLAPLSAAETAELLTTALGGPVDLDTATRLWRLTRGNPLYLRTIVEQEVADGRLATRNELWCWTGEPDVPPRLRDLIEARMGALPDPLSEVVDLLAVGEPIDLRSLIALTSAEAVEEADARGLLAYDNGADRIELRTAHPMYAEVRRRSMPEARYRRLCGRVAGELAARADAGDARTTVRTARLMLESDSAVDPGLLFRAAEAAVWLADLPLADELADAAVRFGAGVHANFIRSHILMWLNRGKEADAVLAAVDTEELSPHDTARLVFLRATNRMVSFRDPAGAKRFADAAAAGVPADAAGLIEAFYVVYWAMTGHPAVALHAAEPLSFNDISDAVAARMGSWAQALAAGLAGRDTGDGAPDDPTRYTVVMADARVNALTLAGRLDEAQRVAASLERGVTELAADTAVLATGTMGRAALAAGRLDTARDLLRSAVDTMSVQGDVTGWCYRSRVPLTTALAMRGELVAADRELAEARAARHPAWRVMDHELDLAAAWVAAADQRAAEAAGMALSAARSACEDGQFAAEVLCLQTAAQFGDPSGQNRLAALATVVDGPRAPIAHRFVQALSAGDVAALNAVSGEFERIGDLVAALDAAALAGNGAVAHQLATRCGGAVTPALRALPRPPPLTSREREIGMLVGQGKTNREIAELLSLSVRTVEGHIYRAMRKTGADSRGELGKVIGGGHA